MLLDLLSHRLMLVGGAEVYWDFVGSRAEDARLTDDGVFPFVESKGGNFSDGSKYRTVGLFVHGNMAVWRINPSWGELHVLAGGRFSNFAAFAPNVPDIGDVNYSFNGFAFAGGVQWIRPDLFNVYGTFTQGFRAPNLQETTVLGDTGSKFEIPNDSLGPERSDTIEAGGKLKLMGMELHGAYFYSLLSDAIDEAPAVYNGLSSIDGKPVIKRVNAREGHYRGVEGSAGIHLWRMTLRAGAAWIEGELTGIDDQTHPARRVPPLFGTAGLRYDDPAGRFHVEILSRLAARQDRLHPSDEQDLRICETSTHSGMLRSDCNGTKGYYTLNLRGGVALMDAFRVNAALMNLTDQKYKTHGSGFYAPGFDARLSIIVDF
jgi:outer membrane receptor protein involved in Fe transport